MRRKSKKEGIYVYVELIHFAVQYKLTQYCKATILQLKKKKVWRPAKAFFDWSSGQTHYWKF